MYWTDPRLHVIEVSRLNGNHRKVLITTGSDKPISVVVDPIRGMLFWSENGDIKRIRRATLSGSEKMTVMNKIETLINDISLDYEVCYYFIVKNFHNILL